MNDVKPFNPFLNGLEHYPEKKQKDVAELRKWYDKQQHLPAVVDEFLLLFLHACYYNQEKTKRAIEQYFNIRTNSPTLFADRNPFNNDVSAVFDYANMLSLPGKTPKGYNVVLYSVYVSDPSKFIFSDAVKAFCLFNDYLLSVQGLSEGYIVLFDMKGCTIGHFARVTLPALRTFMHYIQDAHPARLKEIHVLNTAAFINHVMRLIQPLIQSDLLNILKFHQKLPPEENIPLELYPSEYGGTAPPIRELSEQFRKDFESEPYKNWLIESGKVLVCDNSKRPKKKTWGLFSGPDID